MNIEEIKQKGIDYAIAQEIEQRIHDIKAIDLQSYRCTTRFKGLTAKLQSAAHRIGEIHELLRELQKTDMNND